MIGITIPVIVLAQSKTAPDPIVVDDASCKQRVTLLNFRARLLENYKRTEQDRYDKDIKKFAQRISYAGQWRKDAAQKVRESYNEVQKQFATFTAEIDRQIADYQPLEESQITCSPEDRDKLIQELTKVRGLDDSGKVVGGQALIEQKKREYARYRSEKFEPALLDLMKNVQKAKKKQPIPKDPLLELST